MKDVEKCLELEPKFGIANIQFPRPSHTHTHTHTHTHVHIHTHARTHACAHARTHARAHMRTCTHRPKCAHGALLSRFVRVSTHSMSRGRQLAAPGAHAIEAALPHVPQLSLGPWARLQQRRTLAKAQSKSSSRSIIRCCTHPYMRARARARERERGIERTERVCVCVWVVAGVDGFGCHVLRGCCFRCVGGQ